MKKTYTKLILILVLIICIGLPLFSVGAVDGGDKDTVINVENAEAGSIVVNNYSQFNEPLDDEEDVLGGVHKMTEKQYFTQGARFKAGNYINFGSTSGTSGYGIFDDSGTLRYKNSGGTWSLFGSTAIAGGGWSANALNLAMSPTTNALGQPLIVILGGNATTSAWVGTDELFINGSYTVTGAANIDGAINVAGASALVGNTTITGTLTQTGNAALAGTLSVAGASTFTGNALATSFEAINAGPLYLGTSTATSIEISDTGVTTNIQGPLTAAETVVVTGTFNNVGAVDFDSTLNVDGAATVAAITGDGNWLTTGNMEAANYTVNGTLGVTGKTTMVNASSTTFGASSAAYFGGTVAVTGASTFASTVDVTGVTTLVNASSTNITVSSNAYVGGALAVTGISTLTGAVGVTGLFTAVQASTTNISTVSNAYIGGTLAQTGVATFSADPLIIGTTPKLTIGDAGAEDSMVVFDGNAIDMRVELDDGTDDLVLGVNSTSGTDARLRVAGDTTNTEVIFHDATAADAKFWFDGNAADYYFALEDSADDFVIGTSTTVGSNVALNINQTMDVYVPQLVFSGATTTITATTAAAVLTLTAHQVCDYQFIELDPAIYDTAFALTLPTAALTYADCLEGNGDLTPSIWVFNNSGASATVTAGTAGILLEPNDGDDHDVVIETGNYVELSLQIIDDGAAMIIAAQEWDDAD